MPRLYIISGCNGAGKTTASYSLLPEMLDCKEFVNSDEFAKGLSPFDPSKASIQASRYMLLKIRYLLKRGEDFAIETTLATRTLLKTAKQQNANILFHDKFSPLNDYIYYGCFLLSFGLIVLLQFCLLILVLLYFRFLLIYYLLFWHSRHYYYH